MGNPPGILGIPGQYVHLPEKRQHLLDRDSQPEVQFHQMSELVRVIESLTTSRWVCLEHQAHSSSEDSQRTSRDVLLRKFASK